MFIWLMLCLKIPILGLLYIVWWASRDPNPEPDTLEPAIVRGEPFHPRTPRWPRPPRRGPHAEPEPRPPKRVRAQARRIERSHR
jgi:hypothetical protein